MCRAFHLAVAPSGRPCHIFHMEPILVEFQRGTLVRATALNAFTGVQEITSYVVAEADPLRAARILAARMPASYQIKAIASLCCIDEYEMSPGEFTPVVRG